MAPRLSSTPRLPIAALLATAAATAVLSGCAVGPNYHRPTVPMSDTFKEAEGWKVAQPNDAIDRGKWWEIFNDPTLNALEEKVEVSNQTLIADEAAYREAKAVVAEQTATLFPSVTGTASEVRSKTSAGAYSTGGASGTASVTGVSSTSTHYSANAALNWDIDVWGEIRRSIESAKDQAQVSAANLANARLSAQITLATDYLTLREEDEEKRLIDETVKGYAQSLKITQNKYNAGVSAKADILTAQTTLQSAQAEAVDLLRTRAAYEHAVAVLTGEPPAKLTLALAPWNATVPQTPLLVPSALLERRPDVAAAERTVAAANAQIGVNMAGFFPALSLTGADGNSSSALSQLFRTANNAWSIGPTLTQTLFDAGATFARVRAARATYDQDVALYRQTVLTALQQTEDAIAALRVLEVEEQFRISASKEADQAEAITNNEYKAGTVDYTTLVVAQATALTARTAAIQATLSRLTETVSLIGALGGGWQEPAKMKG